MTLRKGKHDRFGGRSEKRKRKKRGSIRDWHQLVAFKFGGKKLWWKKGVDWWKKKIGHEKGRDLFKRIWLDSHVPEAKYEKKIRGKPLGSHGKTSPAEATGKGG